MNDKQQLATMGAHMAEHPLYMTKRIEELEAQVRVMAGLLKDLRPDIELHLHNSTVMKSNKGIERCNNRIQRIDALLAGKVPNHPEQPLAMVPEGWQLEDLDNDCIVVRKDGVGFYVASFNAENIASTILHALASDILSAAPKPEAK